MSMAVSLSFVGEPISVNEGVVVTDGRTVLDIVFQNISVDISLKYLGYHFFAGRGWDRCRVRYRVRHRDRTRKGYLSQVRVEFPFCYMSNVST